MLMTALPYFFLTISAAEGPLFTFCVFFISALGGLGGAVAGGGIGKATDALNKKLGIEATPGQ